MTRKRKPLEERLNARLDKSGECWVWLGATRPSGYGVIGIRDNSVGSVHRVSYVLAYGSIPDGLHIDHLCRNRACARPSHLEAVTQAENNRRAGAARRAANTHCRRGHEFSPENTFQTAKGARECRTCRNMRERAARRGMTLETFALLLEGGGDPFPVAVIRDPHTKEVAA
jgi:hypothetical protein